MQDKHLSTEELIAQDVGARLPEGFMAKAIAGLALAWSLFQMWIASPLPFIFRIGVLNDTETRSIHLAFALLLAFLAYPAFKRSPRDRVPLLDVALGLVAAASAATWACSALVCSVVRRSTSARRSTSSRVIETISRICSARAA